MYYTDIIIVNFRGLNISVWLEKVKNEDNLVFVLRTHWFFLFSCDPYLKNNSSHDAQADHLCLISSRETPQTVQNIMFPFHVMENAPAETCSGPASPSSLRSRTSPLKKASSSQCVLWSPAAQPCSPPASSCESTKTPESFLLVLNPLRYLF